MTVIVNAIWGGRVCQVVDRQITRPSHSRPGRYEVIDSASLKVCVALCSNALLSVAYTGVAAAHEQWMDSIVSDCLAYRHLGSGIIQTGAPLLGRPVHAVVHDLSLNLNGRLNSDDRARAADLRLSIVGWHLGRRLTPFAWELVRKPEESNGMRYFRVRRSPVGKFLRAHPKGLWLDWLGDTDRDMDNRLRALGQTSGFTHDDVERYVRDTIVARAQTTPTVSSECIAVQLNALDNDGQVQFTHYASPGSTDAGSLLSSWVLTPTIACAPTTQSTLGAAFSECGSYAIGGFSDARANLAVRTRVPISTVHHGGPVLVSYAAPNRAVVQ